ncbi:MAG TPA: DNA-binding response regulator [Firmicutes bacterium]|nr:DNA-binding response regulator [Bacillota bacterium]
MRSSGETRRYAMNETILIIEDEAKVAQIIRAYLEKEGYKIRIITDGAKVIDEIKNNPPDLIILDRMLPNVSGDLLCTQIRQQNEIPILMLSALTTEEERIFGLQIGADDYMIKPFSPKELVTRVMALLRRSKKKERPAPLVLDNGRLLIDPLKYEVYRDGTKLSLTPTEFQLLLMLAIHAGQVFRREALLEKLQGTSYEGYERTIDAHIKNLRQKLEPYPAKPRYIKTIFGVGYKFSPEQERNHEL